MSTCPSHEANPSCVAGTFGQTPSAVWSAASHADSGNEASSSKPVRQHSHVHRLRQHIRLVGTPRNVCYRHRAARILEQEVIKCTDRNNQVLQLLVAKMQFALIPNTVATKMLLHTYAHATRDTPQLSIRSLQKTGREKEEAARCVHSPFPPAKSVGHHSKEPPKGSDNMHCS